MKIFREKVKDKIDEAKLDAIDAQSKANVDDAVAKARAAKYPEVSQLLTDVYVSTKGIVEQCQIKVIETRLKKQLN